MAAPLELLALHHVEASVEAAQSDVARLPQSLTYNWFVVVAVDALVQGQAELVAALDGSGVVAVGRATHMKQLFLLSILDKIDIILLTRYVAGLIARPHQLGSTQRRHPRPVPVCESEESARGKLWGLKRGARPAHSALASLA